MQTNTNVTDTGPHEMHGQGLRAAVEQRRVVLEACFAELQNSEQQGGPVAEAIETALSALDALLPKDLDHISPVVAASLMQWLETHKHLGVMPAKKRRVSRR